MRVHLLHGIHTVLGSPVVEGLIPILKGQGLDVRYPDYGWIFGLETRIANPLIVRSLLPYIEPGDLFIGHSNGCAIGYDLMLLKAPIAGAVFINAALDNRISRPPSVKWIDVYFNPGDCITEAAKIAQQAGLVDEAWGEMGHSGFQGIDPNITNINCAATPSMPFVDGHSDIFTPVKLAVWGAYIVQRVLAHLKPLIVAAAA